MNGQFNVGTSMTTPQLNIIHHLPTWLYHIHPTDLHKHLPGPTLIHLAGHREQPLFVSVLLHGNETTGFIAIQALLKNYREQKLPRSLSIFIGNIEAAKHDLRRLESQVDYNRVWNHEGFNHSSAEAQIMVQVVDEMRRRNVFVSIDIHNNTGLNPHYACINRLEDSFYHLATLFSRTVIYFTHPKGVQSQAFAEVCPAVTIECGQVGKARGILHARQYIEACLGLSALPAHPIPKHDIDLFHTVATIKIAPHISFSFNDSNADLLFFHDLDKLNFSELPAGTVLAKVKSNVQAPIRVINEHFREMFAEYFSIYDHELRTTCPLMPSMLTTDEDIIKKDCLCYLMERMTQLA